MALKRNEKEAIVEDLHSKFSNAVSVIVTGFSGLSVSAANSLRKELREKEGEFKVAKNTLLRRAVSGTSAEVLADQFTGPNAVVMSYDDPVAVAKVLVKFAEENKSVEIKIGMLDGKLMDAAGIEALSKLPSREVLLAQLLSVLVATPTNLVQVLAGIPRKLLYALRAIEEAKQQ